MISSGGDGAAFILGSATYTDEGVIQNFGWATSNTGGTLFRLYVDVSSGAYSQRISMNTAIPFTWATGDSFRFSAYYQAA
jgi:hypothetical protein